MADCKRCSKCGEVKALGEFPQRKDSRDGHRTDCHQCRRAALRSWWHTNKPEPPPGRPRVTPEQRRQRQAEWRRRNALRLAAARTAWGEANPTRRKELQRRAAEQLTDRYVRRVIAGANAAVYAALPAELITLKREQLLLLRLARELKQELEKRNGD